MQLLFASEAAYSAATLERRASLPATFELFAIFPEFVFFRASAISVRASVVDHARLNLTMSHAASCKTGLN